MYDSSGIVAPPFVSAEKICPRDSIQVEAPPEENKEVETSGLFTSFQQHSIRWLWCHSCRKVL